jgi:predicted dehydrogenase
MRQGRALLKMATERERVLMVSYQRHFQPEFMYMHDQVRAGRLGTIEYVQAFQAQEWLRVTQGTWRQRPELSGGGQLNDSGSHLLDVIMWTSGLSVSRVYAQSTSFDTEVDINTALSLRFHGGAMGNVSVVGNAPGWHEEVTLVGSKGAIYYRHAMPLHHVDATGQPVEVKLPKSGSNPDANFVGSIRGREEPRVPAESGLRVLQVTQAAWRSAEKGEAVAIPKSRAVVARA